MGFLVARNTKGMDFFAALTTVIWTYVCALEHTQNSMSWYLEQQTYLYYVYFEQQGNSCYWYLLQQEKSCHSFSCIKKNYIFLISEQFTGHFTSYMKIDNKCELIVE